MTEKQLENINKHIVKQISYYKQNDKLLGEIIFNNHLYGSEKIDIIKDTILHHNCNLQKIKLELLDHQNLLMSKNIKNDFLDNAFTLELIINKFLLRFYSRLYRDQNEINKYWRNEYLDCYKDSFS